MRTVAGENSRVVVVEVVVEPVVVPVPPVVVPIEVADIQEAVQAAVLYSLLSIPPPLEYSERLYRIWYL